MALLRDFARKYICFLRSTRGATAMEYGLIVAGIALGIILALFLTGDALQAIFSDIAADMSSAKTRAGA